MNKWIMKGILVFVSIILLSGGFIWYNNFYVYRERPLEVSYENANFKGSARTQHKEYGSDSVTDIISGKLFIRGNTYQIDTIIDTDNMKYEKLVYLYNKDGSYFGTAYITLNMSTIRIALLSNEKLIPNKDTKWINLKDYERKR